MLAYDAGRFVGEALLAHQGLRPTQAGGHLAVTDPSFPGEHVEAAEVVAAIATAQSLLIAGEQLIEHLRLFV